MKRSYPLQTQLFRVSICVRRADSALRGWAVMLMPLKTPQRMRRVMDEVLLHPPETDAEGNTGAFSIANTPFDGDRWLQRA
jgi:hypothetical protein